MEQLVTAILTLLQTAGLHAAAGMPGETAPRLEAAACGVWLEKAALTPPGFAQYLGVTEDPVHGQTELYGAKLEAAVRIAVFSPAAQGMSACVTAMGAVLDALLAAPDTLRVLGVEADGGCYDAQYDHFTATVRVRLQAWVYAAATGETPVFQEFNLRGELQ